MVGRNFLGLSQGSLNNSYTVFRDHRSGRPEMRQLLALPFKAIRLVPSFLRVSHALWATGCAIGFLLLFSYQQLEALGDQRRQYLSSRILCLVALAA